MANQQIVRVDAEGRKYIDLTPTPEGYAKIIYTLIESGDAEGKAGPFRDDQALQGSFRM